MLWCWRPGEAMLAYLSVVRFGRSDGAVDVLNCVSCSCRRRRSPDFFAGKGAPEGDAAATEGEATPVDSAAATTAAATEEDDGACGRNAKPVGHRHCINARLHTHAHSFSLHHSSLTTFPPLRWGLLLSLSITRRKIVFSRGVPSPPIRCDTRLCPLAVHLSPLTGCVFCDLLSVRPSPLLFWVHSQLRRR